jgi:hypothetical protein
LTIGDVFARAWDLWRRDVGWLILAGLVVGAIMAVVFGVAFAIFGALLAGAGLTMSSELSSSSSSTISGFGAGMGVLGVVVYLVAMFLIQVLGLTFYGGLFEMVIGAYREKRGVVFSDLFAGFRHFTAYLVYALVLLGVSVGLGILGLLPFLGGIIALVVSIWLSVIWIYVLPLIADQQIGFPEAAGRSKQMVSGAGWWWTFGMVILLGLAALAAVIIIVLIAVGFAKASDSVGLVVGILLFLLLAVFFPPYSICYVSVLYVASGGEVEPARPGGLPGIPPAPPAPPAFGAPSPPAAAVPYGGAATGVTAGPRQGGDDAWKAAADPLAAQAPPAPPPAAPASQPVPASQPAPAPAGGDAGLGQTAVTEAVEPAAPEPPAPPAPPGQRG